MRIQIVETGGFAGITSKSDEIGHEEMTEQQHEALLQLMKDNEENTQPTAGLVRDGFIKTLNIEHNGDEKTIVLGASISDVLKPLIDSLEKTLKVQESLKV